jgi:hypothetical protein
MELVKNLMFNMKCFSTEKKSLDNSGFANVTLQVSAISHLLLVLQNRAFDVRHP